MAVAFPLSPELVLVAPPEEAAHARSLLPDPPQVALEAAAPEAVPARPAAAAAAVALAPEAEPEGSVLGSLAVVVYSGILLAAVMFVLVAMVVHEIRFAGGV